MNRLMLGLITLMTLLCLEVFTGEPAVVLADELTVEKLKNGEYKLRCGKVKLTDGGGGKCGEGPRFCCVELSDKVAFGDLDGDGVSDAAAIFWTDTGGHYVWVELLAILNRDGNPGQVALKILGKNAAVKSISIKSGEIFLEIGKHAPDDPMCCPSLSFTQKYKLGGKNLVLLP